MKIRNAAKLAGLAGAAAAGVAAGLAMNGRKRAVREAVAGLHGDWQGRLKAEHKTLRKLLKAMNNTDFVEGARRAVLAEKVGDLFSRYTLEVENVVLPAIQARGGEVDDLFATHASVKLRLRELSETAPEDPHWERKSRSLRRLVDGHVRSLERDRFAVLHASLDDEGNDRLTRLMGHEAARLA